MDLKELRIKLFDFIAGSELLSDVDDWDNGINGESGIDIYINNIDMLNWSEELYNEWFKFVEDYSIEGDGYTIYFSTDVSGYTYWIKNMEETPRLSMVIETKGLTDEQYAKLLDDIIKASNDYDDEETRLWQLSKDKEKDEEDFVVQAESFDSLKEKLKKAITESYEEEEILDPLFKVGSIVTIGITDDEDLNDALEELGDPEIVITDIEDDNFWGETVDRQDIDFHMEYKDISSIRPGELKENTNDKWREELKGLEWKYAESDEHNHANFVYCNIPLVYSSADLYVYAPDAKHSSYWAMIAILHGGKREYDMFKVEGCKSAEEAVAKFKEEIMKKFDVTCELRPIPAEMIEKMEANKITER